MEKHPCTKTISKGNFTMRLRQRSMVGSEGTLY